MKCSSQQLLRFTRQRTYLCNTHFTSTSSNNDGCKQNILRRLILCMICRLLCDIRRKCDIRESNLIRSNHPVATSVNEYH